MKKIGLTTVSIVFLLIITSGIQEQTTQPQLDQLKLMKEQHVGTWQAVWSKDTTAITENQQYGDAFVENLYLVISGNKSLYYINVFCYSPDEGKFKGFAALTNGIYGTWSGSYETEKKFSYIVTKDFNPEVVYMKTEVISESPTSRIIREFSPDGTKIREYTSTKIN